MLILCHNLNFIRATIFGIRGTFQGWVDTSSQHFTIAVQWQQSIWWVNSKPRYWYTWYNSNINICMSGWNWLYIATWKTSYDSYYYADFRINSSAPIPYPRGGYSDYVTGDVTGGYVRFGHNSGGYIPVSMAGSAHKLDPYIVVRINLNYNISDMQNVRNQWITGVMHSWQGSSTANDDKGADYYKRSYYACRSFWLSNSDDDFQW